jgi:hypothetical protein
MQAYMKTRCITFDFNYHGLLCSTLLEAFGFSQQFHYTEILMPMYGCYMAKDVRSGTINGCPLRVGLNCRGAWLGKGHHPPYRWNS